MQIKREKLAEALDAVKPGLNTKEIIEQSTSFVFSEGHISTYNDSIAINYPIDLGFEGAVRSNELYSLLTRIKDEEIDIECIGNELLIKGKRKKAGIELNCTVKLPLHGLQDLKGWQELPDTFLACVKLAAPCASSDMGRPVLTCVDIAGRNVQASDGYCIIRLDMGKSAKKIFKRSLQIPAVAAKTLCRYQVTSFTTTNGWGHFKADNGVIFSCRIFAEDYPDIKPFFKIEGPQLKLPTDMKEMLECAGIFTKADSVLDEMVKVSIEKKKITIRGEGTYGWFEETTKIKYSGEKIEFVVCPTFLYDILGSLRHCIVGPGALKFEGDNFEHVVCLCAKG